MKFKPLTTSKLFFNKWPYKVECVQAGANRMYRNPNGNVNEWTANISRWAKPGSDWTPQRKQELQKFYDKVSPFFDKDLQIRVEGFHFNIFCKDKTLLDEITKELEPWIVTVSGPASEEELNYLLENGRRKRVCNKLPKGKFKYRIYLRELTPLAVRENFFKWSLNYSDKTSISKTTLSWLKGEKNWVQAPFILIEDGATLSMFSLFLANHIRLIEEFILRSSINTKS